MFGPGTMVDSAVQEKPSDSFPQDSQADVESGRQSHNIINNEEPTSSAPGPLPSSPQAENQNQTPAAAVTTAAAAAQQKTPELTDHSQHLPFARLIAVYICMSTCFFVSFMDVNAATTALPAIGRSLGISSSITWVGTSYLLAQCAFQVLYGRLADIFGRKDVLIGCVACLIVGDVLCGFARDGAWLYVCRAVSGIGGGGISSLVQITVSDLVSLRDRGKYQGILSGAIGLGAGIGPFISAAFILHHQERWRWAFWLPAVLAALCIPPLMVLLPQKPVVGSWKEKVQKVDWIGLVTIVTGILFILVGLKIS
jgi:MFS family permease